MDDPIDVQVLGRAVGDAKAPPTAEPLGKKVAVIGGGPAGMKAAVTAAERGHQVQLHVESCV